MGTEDENKEAQEAQAKLDKKESDLKKEPPAADVIDLEMVDMDLGSEEATLEANALNRWSAVFQYNQMAANAKANRSVGNNSKADELDKAMAALRHAVGLIDRDCPKAKAFMQNAVATRKFKVIG